MTIKKPILKPVILAFVMLIICTSACEEKVFVASVDCDECYPDKPNLVDLKIDLSNGYGDTLIVDLYFGKVSDNTYYESYYVWDNPAYFAVEPNHEYSAVAYYNTGNRQVKVIDGTEINLRSVSSACTDLCWIIEGAYLDLRLVYP